MTGLQHNEVLQARRAYISNGARALSQKRAMLMRCVNRYLWRPFHLGGDRVGLATLFWTPNGEALCAITALLKYLMTRRHPLVCLAL